MNNLQIYLRQLITIYGIKKFKSLCQTKKLLTKNNINQDNLFQYTLNISEDTIHQVKQNKFNTNLKRIVSLCNLVNYALAEKQYRMLQTVEQALANNESLMDNLEFAKYLINNGVIVTEDVDTIIIEESGIIIIPTSWWNIIINNIDCLKQVFLKNNYKSFILDKCLSSAKLTELALYDNEHETNFISAIIISDVLDIPLNTIIDIPINPEYLINYDCVSILCDMDKTQRILIHQDTTTNNKSHTQLIKSNKLSELINTDTFEQYYENLVNKG